MLWFSQKPQQLNQPQEEIDIPLVTWGRMLLPL